MNNSRTPDGLTRRRMLSRTAYTLAAVGSGISVLIPLPGRAAAAKVVIKYDWLISNGQIGDVMAVKRGYFMEDGLDVEFAPGGPNSATLPPVVTRQAQLGQYSDSAQLLLARASGAPVRIIACGFRSSPFAFYSLPRAPIRSVQDMVGKRIGTQPTARFVLDAILAKNHIDPNSLTITNIGFDMTPLVTGQVDAVTGWVTNTKALSVIGANRIDLMMSATGLPSYSNVYFATDMAVKDNADTLAKVIGAIAKGWGWTHANPDEAVRQTVAAYPQLDVAIELKTVPTIMKLSFDATTGRDGWGTFSPESIGEQIAIYDKVGAFKPKAPALADCYTTAILEMTAAARPKIA
jgi:NitT/TauT family transport system substrate-binding protein